MYLGIIRLVALRAYRVVGLHGARPGEGHSDLKNLTLMSRPELMKGSLVAQVVFNVKVPFLRKNALVGVFKGIPTHRPRHK